MMRSVNVTDAPAYDALMRRVLPFAGRVSEAARRVAALKEELRQAEEDLAQASEAYEPWRQAQLAFEKAAETSFPKPTAANVGGSYGTPGAANCYGCRRGLPHTNHFGGNVDGPFCFCGKRPSFQVLRGGAWVYRCDKHSDPVSDEDGATLGESQRRGAGTSNPDTSPACAAPRSQAASRRGGSPCEASPGSVDGRFGEPTEGEVEVERRD